MVKLETASEAILLRGFAAAVVFPLWVIALWGSPQAGRKLEVTVRDQSDLAVPGVRVLLQPAGSQALAADTGEEGKAAFFDLAPARYHLSVELKGFEPGAQ